MRDQRFTFLCTKEERARLEQLATRYHRTKGDTIRLLIQEAFERASKDIDLPIKNKDKQSEGVYRHKKGVSN